MDKFLIYYVFLVALNYVKNGKCTNYTSVNKEPRIYGGQKQIQAKARFMVSLWRKDKDLIENGKGFVCGGSLISNQMVLTATHCLVKYPPETKSERNEQLRNLRVIMGTLLPYERKDTAWGLKIKNYVVHENYFHDRAELTNDIAIIQIKDSIPPHQTRIQPIAINTKRLEIGTKCEVMGWGMTDTPEKQSALLVGDVQIMDYTLCWYISITLKQLCAGNMKNWTSTGPGDSGGPLICSGLLVGIVSGGYGDDRKEPQFYTNVSAYGEWIKKEIEALLRSDAYWFARNYSHTIIVIYILYKMFL